MFIYFIPPLTGASQLVYGKTVSIAVRSLRPLIFLFFPQGRTDCGCITSKFRFILVFLPVFPITIFK